MTARSDAQVLARRLEHAARELDRAVSIALAPYEQLHDEAEALATVARRCPRGVAHLQRIADDLRARLELLAAARGLGAARVRVRLARAVRALEQPRRSR